MIREEPHVDMKYTNAAPLMFLVLVTVALFVPFVHKPFNIDDPLFIWTAKHIQHNPLDFYGFDVNWGKKITSMASVNKNPPLFSYFLAGVGIVCGWSEAAMHLAVMVSLIALALGTFRLAGQLGGNPLQAALISMCTPVVMVSGTSVMCDVPMVALWVWAVSYWIDGNEAPYHMWPMLGAGLMIAAAGLTKYFGASLIPLLASYSLMRRTPFRQWFPYLLVPMALFILYNVGTCHTYGIGLMTDAFVFSADVHQNSSPYTVQRIIDSLSFTGGGLITALFFAPLLFRLQGRLICASTMAGLCIILHFWGIERSSNFGISIQQAVFITAASVLLTVAAADFIGNRDAKSLLLMLWVMGTFMFACVVNWTVSERIILPMAPAAGILISRRLALRTQQRNNLEWAGFALALIPALSLSLLVTLADYRWSSEIHKVVQRIRLHSPPPGQSLWFQGHWGFQYYMEQIGGKTLDFAASEAHTGDLLVRPSFTTNFENLPDDVFDIVDTLQTAPLSWLAVMAPSTGAGFYSNEIGPLPYAFDRVTPETYWIHEFKQNMRFMERK